MPEQVTLAAARRDELGSGPARRLRKQGRVPAVLYGHGVEPTPISLDARELYHALHTPAGLNVLIRLELDGAEHLTVPREVQRHPVRDDLLHVDLLAVSAEQRITAEVPVHLVGEEDVEPGGIVSQMLHTLPVRAPVLAVPNYLEVDLSGRGIGDVVRAGDVPLPPDVELDIDPDRTVVTIEAPAAEPVEEVEVAEEVAAATEAEEAAEAPAEAEEPAGGDDS